MIFKALLKYKIFEYCLDTIFEKIKVNFDKTPSGITLGKYYRYIDYFSIDDSENYSRIYTFHHCKILFISSTHVKFSYDQCESFPSNEVSAHYGISTCNLDGLSFYT